MKIPAALTMMNEDPLHILAIEAMEDGCILLKEDGSRLQARESPIALLQRWCLKYGSSLAGRQDAARYYLGKRIEKPPVLISETSGRIFFRLGDHWICYNSVHAAANEGPMGTEITLEGGHKICVNAALRTVSRQLKRCQTYLSLLHEASI